MGCLGWFLIIGGVVALPFTAFSSIISVLIGAAILALGANSVRTRDAVERNADLQNSVIKKTEEDQQASKNKEIRIARRMKELTDNGVTITEAKLKAEMEYTLETENPPEDTGVAPTYFTN